MKTNEVRLQTRTSKTLIDLAKAVEIAPDPARTVVTENFGSLELMQKETVRAGLTEKLGKKCTAIYIIKLGPNANWTAVRDALNLQKTGKLDGRAYPQINKTAASEYMYVGSSRDCVKRLIEHLGLGAKSTYSLHMSSWATSLVGDFEIEILKYTDIDQTVLCAIEDQLSKELKPLFGRRGSR
ncbi:hypothetical protein [Sphingorhabdus sp.]|jgi:hypothetical protein|uniref:hypothetical protein n=1 Tax=Sphingorhabdus sp. TaxID=1902408 RepID=UPI0037C563D8